MRLANRRLSLLLGSASLLAACATNPVQTAAPAMAPAAIAAPAPVEPAPVSALVKEVAIPHQTFTLDNGLTVIVHGLTVSPH